MNWFVKVAPIKAKFRAIVAVQILIGAANLIATYLAATTPPDKATPYIVLVALLVALPILVSFISGRIIANPYVTTVVRMEAMAAGDLTSDVAHTDHADCVGRMTKAMTVFRQNAEEVRRANATSEKVVASLKEGLGHLADRDLGYRIEEPLDGYEQLRLDFNRAMDAIADAMRTVTSTAEGINNGAGDIRQASDDLSRRTEQQAASLEETAAAMDEITATVRDTAEGATRANAVVEDTRSEAEQSGEVVRKAVEAMGGIERASAEISEIISVIDGIAFQTNLLALNAGVEAARAGDAGKGFAVVASEVRALAQRSADAAKDVTMKITASSQQVDVGVELVSEAGKALQRIISRIGEISGLVSTIAKAAAQQANGLQQVNIAVSEMDGVTQQNAAMVEQATAAARSLASEADALALEVTRFKLGNQNASSGNGNVVHELQQRVAHSTRTTSRRLAPIARATGSAAPAKTEDWSSF